MLRWKQTHSKVDCCLFYNTIYKFPKMYDVIIL